MFRGETIDLTQKEKIVKVVIAVVVYDRIGNFIKWLKIAKICKERWYTDFDIEFRIIHHTDNPVLTSSWKKIADLYPVTYITRANKGYDIGVFQKVCEKNLAGFKNGFGYLLWFTDDCFPTDITFLEEFLKPFEQDKNLGVTCFEISKEIRPHVRTTGFCIKAEHLEKIQFPTKEIANKQECYTFEHGQNNLYLQMRKLQIGVQEIYKEIFYNPDSKKIKAIGLEKCLTNLYRFLYDSDLPSALIFATAHNRYPQIVSSGLCQLHANTKIEVWHNGEIVGHLEDAFYHYLSHGIKIKEIELIPGNHYGHPVKKMFLENLDCSKSEYILITNEDNYISPYMIQKAVELLERFPEKIGAYCNGMVHNYKPDNTGTTWKDKKALVNGHAVDGYGLIPCRIERGYIDISAIVFRTSVAKSIPWNDTSHSADWTYIETIANSFGGKDKFAAFPGIHLVHN